jgi:hypothetical protein
MTALKLVPVCADVPRGHCCPICESDCDSTTGLKMQVRHLERLVLDLAFALRESRDLTAFAHRELEQRFPERRAA